MLSAAGEDSGAKKGAMREKLAMANFFEEDYAMAG